MKKVAALLLVLSMALVLCACGSTSKYEGSWVCVDGRAPNGYPDVMTLKQDGTGMADGRACSWSVENDRFTLYLGSRILSYSVSVKGSNIFLNDVQYRKR